MCVPPVKKEYATLVTQRTKLTGMTTANSNARNILTVIKLQWFKKEVGSPRAVTRFGFPHWKKK